MSQPGRKLGFRKPQPLSRILSERYTEAEAEAQERAATRLGLSLRDFRRRACNTAAQEVEQNAGA